MLSIPNPTFIPGTEEAIGERPLSEEPLKDRVLESESINSTDEEVEKLPGTSDLPSQLTIPSPDAVSLFESPIFWDQIDAVVAMPIVLPAISASDVQSSSDHPCSQVSYELRRQPVVSPSDYVVPVDNSAPESLPAERAR